MHLEYYKMALNMQVHFSVEFCKLRLFKRMQVAAYYRWAIENSITGFRESWARILISLCIRGPSKTTDTAAHQSSGVEKLYRIVEGLTHVFSRFQMF